MAKKTLTPSAVVTNNISALPDRPTITASQLKAKFDQYGVDDKAFSNNTLIAELQSSTVGTSGSYGIGHGSAVLSADNLGDAIEEVNNETVHLTGNETVAGIKTFSSSPIVPTATTSGQAVNKGQLDGFALGQVEDRSIAGTKLALKAVSVLEVADNTLTEAQMDNDMKKDISGGVASANNSYRDNILINGGFQINQLVKSGTVTLAAGEYGHDMWKAGAIGCTYTFSTTANVTTLTISAGSLKQIVEGLSITSGTHCLSWNGTAQGKIESGSYGASGITGTLTGGTNATIEFNTGTLSNVKLEKGSYITAFQLEKISDELSKCQRYFEKSYPQSIFMSASSGQGIESKIVPSNTIANLQPYGKIKFNTKKRGNPTVIIYPFTTPSNTGRVSTSNGTDLGANSGIASNTGEDGFAVYNNSGGTLTVTDNQVIFNWSADARL